MFVRISIPTTQSRRFVLSVKSHNEFVNCEFIMIQGYQEQLYDMAMFVWLKGVSQKLKLCFIRFLHKMKKGYFRNSIEYKEKKLLHDSLNVPNVIV